MFHVHQKESPWDANVRTMVIFGLNARVPKLLMYRRGYRTIQSFSSSKIVISLAKLQKFQESGKFNFSNDI